MCVSHELRRDSPQLNSSQTKPLLTLTLTLTLTWAPLHPTQPPPSPLQIRAACFEGLTLVQRHKMVYALLTEEIRGGVHALSIDAKTPSE